MHNKNSKSSNLGNLIAGSSTISDCNTNLKLRGTSIVRWDRDTLNTTFKFGLSPAAEGIVIDVGVPEYRTQISIGFSDEICFIRRFSIGGEWTTWKHSITDADLRDIIKTNILNIDYNWDNNSPKLIVTDANGVAFYAPLTRK